MDLLVRCLEQSILSNGGAYDGDESHGTIRTRNNWPNKHKVVGNSSTENFGFRSKTYTIYHHINMGESFCFFANLPCPLPQYHRIANSVMSGCHSFKVSGFFCILKKPSELGVNNVPNSWAVTFHWIESWWSFFLGILISWLNEIIPVYMGSFCHPLYQPLNQPGWKDHCSARKLAMKKSTAKKNRVWFHECLH